MNEEINNSISELEEVVQMFKWLIHEGRTGRLHAWIPNCKDALNRFEKLAEDCKKDDTEFFPEL
jgi:hypothetical protein